MYVLITVEDGSKVQQLIETEEPSEIYVTVKKGESFNIFASPGTEKWFKRCVPTKMCMPIEVAEPIEVCG